MPAHYGAATDFPITIQLLITKVWPRASFFDIIIYMKNSYFTKKTLLAISLLVVLFLPQLAKSAGLDEISALPAYPDPGDPRTNNWFVYSLKAGESKEDALKIINDSYDYVNLRIYAVDATTTSGGDFNLNEESAEKKNVASWLDIPVTEVTMEPQQDKLVPFTITIPENTISGDYLGGLIIEPLNNETGKRLAVRIYETVPGPVIKKLTISSLREQLFKDDEATNWQRLLGLNKRLVFFSNLKNDGNAVLEPTATLTIKNIFGGEVAKLKPVFNSVFPYQTNEYPINWGRVPFLGRYKAELKIEYDSKLPTVSQSIIFWTIPYLALAWLVIVIILLVIIRLLVIFRRETKKPKKEKAKKEKPAKKKKSLNKKDRHIFIGSLALVAIIILVFLIVANKGKLWEKEKIIEESSQENTEIPQANVGQDILSRDQERKADLAKIKEALGKYYTDKKAYPVSPTSIAINRDELLTKELVKNDYLKELPSDPMAEKDLGYYYGYRSEDGQSFELTCLLENKDDPEGKQLGSYWLYTLTQ